MEGPKQGRQKVQTKTSKKKRMKRRKATSVMELVKASEEEKGGVDMLGVYTSVKDRVI